MSFLAQPHIEGGESAFVKTEFDDVSIIGLSQNAPHECISLGYLEATSSSEKIYQNLRTPGEYEVIELGNVHSPSRCGSISIDSSSAKAKKERRKIGGDCHQLYSYKCSFTFCALSLLMAFILCFIFNPQHVELCLKLQLDDKDIMQKVLNDKGSYEMNVINPNNIDVYIYGLEIKAYYGGVVDENLLLKADKMDFNIPAHGTYSSDQTYTFIKNSTAAVPIQTFIGCSMEYRQFIAFDMVTSFEACLKKFICPGRIVKESVYKSNCPEDDMVCTKLEIF